MGSRTPSIARWSCAYDFAANNHLDPLFAIVTGKILGFVGEGKEGAENKDALVGRGFRQARPRKPDGEMRWMVELPTTILDTMALLRSGGYLADRPLATAVFLGLALRRPLFLEGEAGVGKTEIAKTLALTLGRRLERLQCYEGLDQASALYEWNYPAQMIAIRMREAGGAAALTARDVFTTEFLIHRPLLRALQCEPGEPPPVLLIDELDRADEPFEAFLLEVLAESQVTIPEIGTIGSAMPPIVVITSNRTREIHDAIKRRCFYYWVEYPSAERELEILAIKAPGAASSLAAEVVAFVQELREMELLKTPGVAETIDWAHALVQLDRVRLDHGTVTDTLGVLLKYQEDIARLQGDESLALLERLRAGAGRNDTTAQDDAGTKGRDRQGMREAPA